jgi:hypothetical protein
MSVQPKKLVTILVLTVWLILACNIGATPPPPASSQPAFDPTKAALEFQSTMMAQQLTQSANNSQPPAQPSPVPPQPTAPPLPTVAAPVAPPTQAPPTEAKGEDIEAKIKSANVLLYENTDALGIGMWVQDALDGLGMRYTQTGSYSGRFMEHLNSGKKYDLIIVDAEDQSAVTGEFWDVINTRLVRDKAALIVEVWYLDRESNGPISKILSKCGVRYQKDYNLADSIYWWESDHPVFNEPNTVLPLLHYNRYWTAQAGDQIRLSGTGDAILLAGLAAQKSSQESVLASCYEGRVIIQTFCDHDYNSEDIIPLWQNYIYYTLKNHFLATK